MVNAGDTLGISREKVDELTNIIASKLPLKGLVSEIPPLLLKIAMEKKLPSAELFYMGMLAERLIGYHDKKRR